MAKEIDPVRAKSALAVVKQHPGMVLFPRHPAIVALGVVWWLVGSGWAALLFIALVLGGWGCAAAEALTPERAGVRPW